MEYATVKLIHVIGAILFLGNIIVSAVWKIQADRTNNPVVIAFACRLINVTDLAFTALGSALIVIGGIGLFHATGIALSDAPYLIYGIGLFGMAAMLWLVGLLPLQIYMSKIAAKTVANSETEMPASYEKCRRLWNMVGRIAILFPLGALYLMIMRPDF
ncbi:DUF2269 family protein [Thalassospira indica]|uniref:DUF2269 family protein n=1 Tax=Thalassospira indica TaxID=1891279 RepID=A0ABM6XXP0_9PROT|nr:DUF2269 family protein [Thalassospira indica]AXO14451.1 DUF2269 family protein [Thalassospira indica]OAZ11404.1 hypothetical protein TH15_18225 [Thalassospira profundimaris]